jgi:hypothetical protein
MRIRLDYTGGGKYMENEEFVVQLRINGEIIRQDILNNAEVILLFMGLDYAKQRDFSNKRREEYGALIRKLRFISNNGVSK